MPAAHNRLVRVLKIGALAGVAIGVVRKLRGEPQLDAAGHASWLPLTEPPTAAPRTGPVTFSAAAAPDQTWVEPVDGACPASHPIKGNADSGIFHVPDGRSYERTVPERCYGTAADAEADGFRQAKR